MSAFTVIDDLLFTNSKDRGATIVIIRIGRCRAESSGCCPAAVASGPLIGLAASDVQTSVARAPRRYTLNGMAYRHLLVAYDGTSEGDEAIAVADTMAHRDRMRLTIVVVVVLEEPVRWATRWPRGTRVWNDVLLDAARADLNRAARLVTAPAELTVLFGPPTRALPDGAREFDCDAIMLPPRPRRRLVRLLSRNHAAAIRRRASCEVLQPR